MVFFSFLADHGWLRVNCILVNTKTRNGGKLFWALITGIFADHLVFFRVTLQRSTQVITRRKKFLTDITFEGFLLLVDCFLVFCQVVFGGKFLSTYVTGNRVFLIRVNI